MGWRYGSLLSFMKLIVLVCESLKVSQSYDKHKIKVHVFASGQMLQVSQSCKEHRVSIHIFQMGQTLQVSGLWRLVPIQ